MKFDLILILFLFLGMFALSTSASGQTNAQQFPNITTNTFSLDRNDIRGECCDDTYLNYMGYLMKHSAAPETLPADQDKNDLWGPSTNGMQLSIRFSNKEYTAGGVMPVLNILRNLEYSSRTLLLTNTLCFYLTLVVCNGTNGCLPERKFERVPGDDYSSSMPSPPRGFMEWKWEARSEKETALDLNKHFDMSLPGEYSVRAICRVYSPDTKVPLYEISSGTASFRLLPKPPPDAQK